MKEDEEDDEDGDEDEREKREKRREDMEGSGMIAKLLLARFTVFKKVVTDQWTNGPTN